MHLKNNVPYFTLFYCLISCIATCAETLEKTTDLISHLQRQSALSTDKGNLNTSFQFGYLYLGDMERSGRSVGKVRQFQLTPSLAYGLTSSLEMSASFNFISEHLSSIEPSNGRSHREWMDIDVGLNYALTENSRSPLDVVLSTFLSLPISADANSVSSYFVSDSYNAATSVHLGYLSDPLYLSAAIGVAHSFGGSSNGGLPGSITRLQVSGGVSFIANPDTSIRLEVISELPLSERALLPDLMDLSISALHSFSPVSALECGVRFPITHAYTGAGIFVSVTHRF